MNVLAQIAKLSQVLPPEKQAEVLDFVEFLVSRQLLYDLDGREASGDCGQNDGVPAPYPHQQSGFCRAQTGRQSQRRAPVDSLAPPIVWTLAQSSLTCVKRHGLRCSKSLSNVPTPSWRCTSAISERYTTTFSVTTGSQPPRLRGQTP